MASGANELACQLQNHSVRTAGTVEALRIPTWRHMGMIGRLVTPICRHVGMGVIG
jgi:hypothetical protein